MRSYDLPRDQHLFHIRIGIDTPISEMVRSFFIRGQARLHLPRVAVGSYCETLSTPAFFVAGDRVPLIYARPGGIYFGSAKWGTEDRSSGGPILLKQAELRSVGFPALIPASFVDLALDPEGKAGMPQAVRLRGRGCQPLYLGCTFTNDRLAEAQTVTPLICGPGPDIALHADWQPLLIPIAGPPAQCHFDFLLRRDLGGLQVPSAFGSVSAEIISLNAEAMAPAE